jgi:hypothetical protein
VHAAPACDTVKVRPPMVMDALRGRELGFASTVNSISVELELPAGMPVIQEGTLLLVQSHPAEVFTANELAPPFEDAS